MKPAISVLVVSDYAGGEARSWTDLRACLTALAAEDDPDAVEVVFCEDERFRDAVPPEVTKLHPNLRMCFFPTGDSYALLNAGMHEVRAPIVGVLDADCTPAPGWLLAVRDSFAADPEIAFVSGRTTYAARGTLVRILALLSRAYVDAGRSGPTRYVSKNNFAVRREVYLRYPLPEGLGPFAALVQSAALGRDRQRLWFNPAMLAIHAFDGWPMEVDLRRNAGFGTVITRLHDPQLSHAGLIRAGRFAVPVVVVGKIWHSWRDCLRCWQAFGLRLWELPLALLTSIVVHLLEVPGMLDAYAGRPLRQSEFR